MLIFVTGGVASGKSEIAEGLSVSVNRGKMVYIATMNADEEESRKRVHKHSNMRRGKGFDTLEAPHSLALYFDGLKGCDTALLECLTNLTANEMYLAGRSGQDTVKYIGRTVGELNQKIDNLIIVSGIIYSGINPYDKFTEEYLKVLGRINCSIAQAADIVIEAVCSIPVIHKGKKELPNEMFF